MSWEVIVVGGGHNGLTAATWLAQRGKRVLLLEARDHLGGMAAADEFHPGYQSPGVLHDSSGVRPRIVKKLGLDLHGLQLAERRPRYALIGQDGEHVLISPDVNEAVQNIAAFSSKDAEAYRAYRNFLDKISPLINQLFNEAPPDLTDLNNRELLKLGRKAWQLKRLGNKTMLRFLRSAPMSVADFMHEQFETEFLKAGLCAPALYGGYVGPWSSGTTLNLLVHECIAQTEVIGGPSALVEALENAVQAAGVDIRTGARVEEIVVKDQQVMGVRVNGEVIPGEAIATSCSPHSAILDLIAPRHISYPLEQGIKHFRARGVTAKVHLAMREAPVWNYDLKDVRYTRICHTIDEMERAFDAIKYRRFSDRPILDTYVDATGTGRVISALVHFAPYKLDGGWTEEQQEQLLENVLRRLEPHMAGLRDSIVGSEVLTPEVLASRYALPHGNIYHGEWAIDQLITRPIPSCMQYSTPIRGLFLCGSGSHPGGGISCAPGWLGAEAILRSGR